MKFCKRCKQPILDPDEQHGNQQYHKRCAKEQKLERQKQKYQIGNAAKLLIQKNDAVLAKLDKLDPEKKGIPYYMAIMQGLNLDCHSKKYISPFTKKEIFIFDNYCYSIETINKKTLIFIHNVNEL